MPSTIALLPAYAGREDPFADVRAACLEAVGALVRARPRRLLLVAADPRPDNVARGVRESQGRRVGCALLAAAGVDGSTVQAAPSPDRPGELAPGDGVLVVANGSARRSDKAPGHLDDRAFAFDAAVDAALRSSDGPALRALDAALGAELWCHDVPALHGLGEALEQRPGASATVGYDGDPYGVRYWVAAWT